MLAALSPERDASQSRDRVADALPAPTGAPIVPPQDLIAGRDFHHGAEAVFKSFARALRQACALDGRVAGVPSTKGVL